MPDVVIPVRFQDPDANLDWVWDWTPWLAPGETILTSTFTVSAGLDLGATSSTLASTTVWLSGGAPGSPYLVTNHIVTSAGRADDRSMTLRITNR